MKNLITEFNNFLKYHYQPLYHALTGERAYKFLTENKIPGYSFQRYWKDGKLRKDNEEDYETSYFYKGISTTRDLDFAKSWKDIIFVLNQDELRKKYKIVPYQWNATIGADYIKDHKKEKEEFVITGYFKNSFYKIKSFYKRTKLLNKLQKSIGEIKPLDDYLIGIHISNEFKEFIGKTYLEYIEKHPKFLGYI